MAVISCSEYRTSLRWDAASQEPLSAQQYADIDEHDTNCAPCRIWAETHNTRSKPPS